MFCLLVTRSSCGKSVSYQRPPLTDFEMGAQRDVLLSPVLELDSTVLLVLLLKI